MLDSINLYKGATLIRKHNMEGKSFKKGLYIVLLVIVCSFTMKATPGEVSYYWNLSDTNNTADYLIISHEDFYDNADLFRLAQYRADNNNFNVGIVNLSDITNRFNETETDQLNDTAIKNFIAYVYENWTKKERLNNDIFVLLVGDVAAEGEIDYMPAHMSDLLDVADNMFLTDNWYADVNGSDRKMDVYLGRFSVKDNENLSIITNKTIKYENESLNFQGWGKRMYFINGNGLSDVETTFNDIKNSYTNQFQFSYLDLAPQDGYLAEATQDIIDNISEGRFITNYLGEGQSIAWSYSAGIGLGCSNISLLGNSDNLTIILSLACRTNNFNWTSDSLGECMTNADEKGAVAFLGATGSSGSTTDQWFDKRLFRAIFENNSATLGEAVKLAKDMIIDIGGTRDAELYSLLGDPALGIKDYSPPDISIAWPGNGTVAFADLNFSLVESNSDSCWYSNDSGVTNYSLVGCANTTLSLLDGSYRLILWANDTNGNENVSYIVDFILDTVYPNISLSSPENGASWTSSNSVDFSYAVTDIGITNCSLIVNDAISTTASSVTVDTPQSFSSVSLSNGAYTWSINCTDNAGQENNSATSSLTVSYTAPPSSGGGGGGGGMTVVGGDNVETVRLVTGAKAGETKTLSFTKDVSVTGVDITLNNNVNELAVTVEKLADKPTEATTPLGKIYTYLKAEADLKQADISTVSLKFKVKKGWLAQEGFLAEEIVLKRFNNSTWETLPTTHRNNDAEYHYYTAESDGFSYFAITAEKKSAPATTEPKEEEKPSESPQQPQQKEKLQEPAKQNKLKYALYGLLLVMAVGITAAGLKGRKFFAGKKEEKPPLQLPSFEELEKEIKVETFYRQKVRQGYTKDDITKAAANAGWDKEKIKSIIEKL